MVPEWAVMDIAVVDTAATATVVDMAADTDSPAHISAMEATISNRTDT